MDDPAVLGAAAAFCVLAPVFVRRSLRHPRPLLDVRLLRIRSVWSANLAAVFLSMIGSTIWFGWPFFMISIWDYGPLGAGLGMAPGGLTTAVVSMLASRGLDRRRDPKPMLLASTLFTAAGALWMLLAFGSEAHYWTHMFRRWCCAPRARRCSTRCCRA